jgi:hypothetical protein
LDTYEIRRSASESSDAREFGENADVSTASRSGQHTLFSSFDLPQYITPLLHCELGAGDNGFNSFVSEAQAACEEYSEAYVQLETNLRKAKAAYYVRARDEKKHTTDALRQRKTEIKESKDEDATLDDEDIAILNLELSEIQSAIKSLSDEDAKNKKKEQDDAKGAFEEETKKKQIYPRSRSILMMMPSHRCLTYMSDSLDTWMPFSAWQGQSAST